MKIMRKSLMVVLSTLSSVSIIFDYQNNIYIVRLKIYDENNVLM